MTMAHLTTYLNDHLAGSVAALELLDHLIASQKDVDSARFFTELRTEVTEDQGTLEELLHQLGGTESRVRKAAAWLVEKVGRAKLLLEDTGDGELHLLEALETLALGIQGKLALWHGLAAAADRLPQLQGVDLARLQRRAVDQHARVEARRLDAARAAFTPTR